MKLAALCLSLVLPAAALAQDAPSADVPPGVPFKEGDVLTFGQVDKLILRFED